MKIWTGFLMAWGSFCAVPCPVKKWDENARKWCLATLPIVGLLMGLVWFGLFLLLRAMVAPLFIQAAIMTVYPFLVTGHIHLDGFMDCSDAIMSRKPIEEKKLILKDSHVGAFAVISLVIMMVLFFGAVGAMIDAMQIEKMIAVIVISPLVRTIVVLDVMRKAPIDESQYQETFDGEIKPFIPIMVGTVVVSLGLFLLLMYQLGVIKPLLFISMCIIPFVVAGFAGAYARRELGGMNGDVAGYSIVWGELAGVVALAIL